MTEIITPKPEPEKIQYAALIPSDSALKALEALIARAAAVKGFKPVPAKDAHLTVGYQPQGFDAEALQFLARVENVELQSAVAQNLRRKNGNLHLIFIPNTQQIALAIEFPSHQVNALKAKLHHVFDGRLSLSHMTIGVLDAASLGLDISQLKQLFDAREYDTLQAQLDSTLSAFLATPEAEVLAAIAHEPITLSMKKVHASAHTECPLDITNHPNPLSTRANALEGLKTASISGAPDASSIALAQIIQHIMGSSQRGAAAAR